MAKPEIRLKGFEGEWMRASFSESFHFLKNNSLSRAELNYGNGIVKNIHYGDVLIKFGEILNVSDSILPFITNNDVASKQDRDTLLENGDIVFADAAEDNTVGKCTEIEGLNSSDKIVSGLHTIPSRPNYAFEKGYLGYYLNSNAFHDQLLPMIQGTKVSGISKANLNCTYISYPPNTFEQTALADYFKSLDSMIQGVTKKIASLKQMKQACLVSMFPQEGETTPRVRFKGFKRDWERITFGSLIKECMDRSTQENEDILLSSSIEGMFLNSELFSHQRGRSNIGYRKIRKNMMILSAQNLHLGNANVNLRFEHGLVSPAYKIYDIIGCSPLFMHCWIKREETKKFFLDATTSGASLCRKNIVWNDLYNQFILIPSIEEQEKIGSFFHSLDSQISLQEQRLEKLKQIKSACLDKMFV